MKKLTFLAILLMLMFASLTAHAQSHVNQIDMQVEILENGDARIQQVWHGEFNEGTENYIVIGTDEDSNIKDFTVSDESGQYETVKNWDIERSFDEKANKCGIVSYEDRCELCFGISKYGERTYTVNYTVTNLAREYSACDGFNYMFINPGMNIFPVSANVCISLEDGNALSKDNAFAKIEGCAAKGEFSDGKLFVKTIKPLEGDECLIIALDIEKGVIYPKAGSEDDASAHIDIDGKLVYSIFGVACFTALAFTLAAPVKEKLKNKAEDSEKPGKAERRTKIGGQSDAVSDSEIIYSGLIKLLACDSIEIKNGNIYLKKAPIDREAYNMYRVFLNASREEKEISFDKLLEYTRKNPSQLESFFIEDEESEITNECEFSDCDRGAVKQLSRLMCNAKEK